MLARGLAYRDYMTPAELDALRTEQMSPWRRSHATTDAGAPRTRKAVTPPANVRPVIRFRNPDTGTVRGADGVKGRIEFRQQRARRPRDRAQRPARATYNFCAVVDDRATCRSRHVIPRRTTT
jgi:glutamyl-tRNA synthetase